MLSKKKLVLVPNSTIMRMSFTYYLGMFYLFFLSLQCTKWEKSVFQKSGSLISQKKFLNDLFAIYLYFRIFVNLINTKKKCRF